VTIDTITVGTTRSHFRRHMVDKTSRK